MEVLEVRLGLRPKSGANAQKRLVGNKKRSGAKGLAVRDNRPAGAGTGRGWENEHADDSPAGEIGKRPSQRGQKSSPRGSRNLDFYGFRITDFSCFLGRFLTRFPGSESDPVFWVRIRPSNSKM